MGKTRNAMKIHWNGQVGHVVGYTRRGHDYWRSLSNHYRNPRTDAQMLCRAKFAFTSAVARAIGQVYKLGYRHYNTSKSQRANFFHQLFYNAISGDLQSGFTIDYTKALVARGNLTPAYNILAVVNASAQTVTVSWSDNSGVGDASASDTLIYALHNVTQQVSIYAATPSTRADETADFTYPAEWAGDTLYLFVAWSSGATESNSKTLGPYTA